MATEGFLLGWGPIASEVSVCYAAAVIIRVCISNIIFVHKLISYLHS